MSQGSTSFLEFVVSGAHETPEVQVPSPTGQSCGRPAGERNVSTRLPPDVFCTGLSGADITLFAAPEIASAPSLSFLHTHCAVPLCGARCACDNFCTPKQIAVEAAWYQSYNMYERLVLSPKSGPSRIALMT